jgi:hypothetical protein
MLDKPQLVGERRSATGAIGRQLRILRETDGRRKLHRLSSVMAAMRDVSRRVSTSILFASSMLCATPVSANRNTAE